MIDTISVVPQRIRSGMGRVGLLLPTASALAACSPRSAPALVLFGAYFPDWLLFAILAALVAIVARIVFGLVGLAQSIPFPLLTCLAIGVLVAGTIDLLWLDR